MVAILARDLGPSLAFQALLDPATNLERDTRSHADFAEGYLLTGALQQWCKDHYLAIPGDAEDWRASPVLAADLSGLPPAYVMTAGYDPLRDEGQAYAECLETTGVPVAYRCFEGQIHGFLTMGRVIDAAAVAITEAAAHIRQGTARSP